MDGLEEARLRALELKTEAARVFADGRYKAFVSMMQEAQAGFEAGLEHVLAHAPPPVPLPCGPGCGSCCHISVDAARPELVYLAVRLREERDSRDIDRILQSCRLHLRLSEGDILRAGYECPLLERGLCTAYELRPFTCRGCNSLDASDCRKGFARRDPEYPIRRYAPQAKLADVYRGALTGAAVDAGLRAGPVTLAEGLWTLLQMRMPFRYWLQGGEIRTRRNIVRLRR